MQACGVFYKSAATRVNELIMKKWVSLTLAPPSALVLQTLERPSAVLERAVPTIEIQPLMRQLILDWLFQMLVCVFGRFNTNFRLLELHIPQVLGRSDNVSALALRVQTASLPRM